MNTRNRIFGAVAAGLVVGAFFALASSASAEEKGLKIAPAVYRTSDEGTPRATIQQVRHIYYYGGWGGYYGPVVGRPYVYGPAPVVGFGYPTYPVAAPAYAYPPVPYAYPPPVYGYPAVYGPRVAVGIW